MGLVIDYRVILATVDGDIQRFESQIMELAEELNEEVDEVITGLEPWQVEQYEYLLGIRDRLNRWYRTDEKRKGGKDVG